MRTAKWNQRLTPMQVCAVYDSAQHAPDNVQATAATAEVDGRDEPAALSEQPKHVPDKHGWANRSAKKPFPRVEVCELNALSGSAVDARNRRATGPLYVASPTVKAGRPIFTVQRFAAVGWPATSFRPLRAASWNSWLLRLVGGLSIARMSYTGVYSLAATYLLVPTAPFAARSFSNSDCMSRVRPNPGRHCVGLSGAVR
jgi:hypothetical protein